MTLQAFVPWKCPACPHINRAADERGDSNRPGWKLVTQCPGCQSDVELVRMQDGYLGVTHLQGG